MQYFLQLEGHHSLMRDKKLSYDKGTSKSPGHVHAAVLRQWAVQHLEGSVIT